MGPTVPRPLRRYKRHTLELVEVEWFADAAERDGPGKQSGRRRAVVEPAASVELRSTAGLAHCRDDEGPVGEATRFKVAEEASSASSSSPIRRIGWVLEPHDGGAGPRAEAADRALLHGAVAFGVLRGLALKGLGSSHANEADALRQRAVSDP